MPRPLMLLVAGTLGVALWVAMFVAGRITTTELGTSRASFAECQARRDMLESRAAQWVREKAEALEQRNAAHEDVEGCRAELEAVRTEFNRYRAKGDR